MTTDGPKVLEFNVRLGDPETQPLMHRLDSPFGEALLASATGNLAGVSLRWKPQPSVCVVLAAAGYPGQVRTGDLITGIHECGTQVFQAGTKQGPKGLETAGGRVLGVTASGIDLAGGSRPRVRGRRKDSIQGDALSSRHCSQRTETMGSCYNQDDCSLKCGDVAQMDRAVAS